MPHWIECIFRGYFWIAAIGFPIALPWALQNAHDMKFQYFIGYENGEGHTLDLADRLYDKIKHGDEEHKAWLKTAIDDHFYGAPTAPEATVEE